MKNFLNLLRLREINDCTEEFFGEDRIRSHIKTLDSKKAFQTLATDIQHELLRLVGRFEKTEESYLICEIGAGVIPLSNISDRVFSTDLVHNPNLHLQLNAEEMPFSDKSLSAIVGQNVFHHFQNYQKVLFEMQRVLAPGGVIVLLEPSHNWISRIVYPRLFPFEGFDLDADPRCELLTKDSKVVPNQALSWIVFNREVEAFSTEFPNMEIVCRLQLSNGIRYLGSGGLNFRQLIPTRILSILRKLEQSRLFSSLLKGIALHWVVIVRMKPNSILDTR